MGIASSAEMGSPERDGELQTINPLSGLETAVHSGSRHREPVTGVPTATWRRSCLGAGRRAEHHVPYEARQWETGHRLDHCGSRRQHGVGQPGAEELGGRGIAADAEDGRRDAGMRHGAQPGAAEADRSHDPRQGEKGRDAGKVPVVHR